MESASAASLDGKVSAMMPAMHSRCLICNGASLKPLPGYSKIFLVKCTRCGFIFSRAKPSEQELIEHYNHYPRKDYRSPVTVNRYNEILNYFEKFRKTNRLMDVGCGIGYFLEVARERGWEVYGIEFTDDAVEICREKKIEIKKGKLQPGNYTPSSFDVLTSFEVIEHINNPVHEVENFLQLLHKGGVVYLTTPNYNSLSRAFLKEKWNIFAYPEHLCYYTPTTLSRLFTNKGFSKLKMETNGISASRIKSSLRNLNDPSVSPTSDDEKIRTMLESNQLMKGLKNLMNGTLSLLGSGDTIKATFIKR